MEMITTFEKSPNIYDSNHNFIDFSLDMTNKLFCTFTDDVDLDGLVQNITSSYKIMYNKLFVLYIKSTNEYVLTYNVDEANISEIPLNTILVHHKKETNTLYTINALNLISSKEEMDWKKYKYCFLTVSTGLLKVIKTKLKEVIELDKMEV